MQTRNRTPRALYEKMGFAVEGTRRDAMRVGGSYVDEYTLPNCSAEPTRSPEIYSSCQIWEDCRAASLSFVQLDQDSSKRELAAIKQEAAKDAAHNHARRRFPLRTQPARASTLARAQKAASTSTARLIASRSLT